MHTWYNAGMNLTPSGAELADCHCLHGVRDNRIRAACSFVLDADFRYAGLSFAFGAFQGTKSMLPSAGPLPSLAFIG